MRPTTLPKTVPSRNSPARRATPCGGSPRAGTGGRAARRSPCSLPLTARFFDIASAVGSRRCQGFYPPERTAAQPAASAIRPIETRRRRLQDRRQRRATAQGPRHHTTAETRTGRNTHDRQRRTDHRRGTSRRAASGGSREAGRSAACRRLAAHPRTHRLFARRIAHGQAHDRGLSHRQLRANRVRIPHRQSHAARKPRQHRRAGAGFPGPRNAGPLPRSDARWMCSTTRRTPSRLYWSAICRRISRRASGSRCSTSAAARCSRSLTSRAESTGSRRACPPAPTRRLSRCSSRSASLRRWSLGPSSASLRKHANGIPCQAKSSLLR